MSRVTFRPVSPRESRIRRNQDLLRAVNDEIAVLADHCDDRDLEVVCECPDTGCNTMLTMAVGEYSRIRMNPGWFVIASGHAVSDDERAIEDHGTYQIVTATDESGQPVN